MEKKVIFRDRQEFQSADINNVQDFTETSLQHFMQDAITPERLFVGLLVTTPSATELEIAAGHLWDGVTGNVYVKTASHKESMISNLPVVDERWLALSVIGQEVEVDIEPRDFLIDLNTLQTEPRQVAMTESKVAELHIVAGLESSDPQKPNQPTGYTLIAYVRLSPSGVEEILIAENNRLMSLFQTWTATQNNKLWIDATDPQIASIKSDIAALASKLSSLQPNTPLLTELTRDVASLKDIQDLPDNYSTYGSDWLLDEGEVDVNNADYEARTEEGARFPWANMNMEQPDLFNPYADEVINHNGFLLPAYEDHIRLDLSNGHVGSLAIGQYQYSTTVMVQGTRTRVSTQYGPTREVCTNSKNYNWLKGKASGGVVSNGGQNYLVGAKYDEHGGNHWYRVQNFWQTSYTETYMYPVTKTHTITGSQIAQTILAHQSGWLTGIDLYFDSVGKDGDIILNVTETALGQPDVRRSLGMTTVSPGNLKKRPTPVFFEFPEPIFLEAGKLYALVLTTQGQHKISLTQGTNYTQGTLFTSVDGVYHQGDFKKDFMMRLHFAKFVNPRTTVELTSMGLDGGVADIDLDLELIEPTNTEMIIEYRKEGDALWYPICETTADQLLGKPPLLHLRAIFKGDEFVMPGFNLVGSTIQVARPANSMRHISTSRVLPTPSDNIVISLRLEGWNGEKHTCDCKLRQGDVLTAATSVTETVERLADRPTIVKKFVFELGAAIDDYQIQIEGATTSELELFHVAYRHDLAR